MTWLIVLGFLTGYCAWGGISMLLESKKATDSETADVGMCWLILAAIFVIAFIFRVLGLCGIWKEWP